ncbi:hypothetical protein Bca52824_095347 [Brassica carinata]|uniref:Uncharacterized protein n=1 Tax=Brassica carinata TaxID=52824 RepID=A0A8X7TJV1_BRACI|nr:hypothetical protein Bca52824_095347 [Brassica carinata]
MEVGREVVGSDLGFEVLALPVGDNLLGSSYRSSVEFKTVPTFESIGEAIGSGGCRFGSFSCSALEAIWILSSFAAVFVKGEVCPLDTKNTERVQRSGKEEMKVVRGMMEKYDDRARSYKDQWLAAVHGMQEDQVDLDDEGVMDMYEIMAHLENGIDMDLEDF